MKAAVLALLLAICSFAGVQAKARLKRATYYDVYRALDTKNETEAVRLIRDGTDANFRDGNEQIAMHYVAKYGFVEAAKALLEKGYGSQINIGDKWGDTSLHEAASRNSINVMKILLENGGEINKGDRYGKTPLHWAADKGFERLVKLLLEKGADMKAKDENGDTPIAFAKKSGHQKVIDVLEVAEKLVKKIKINKYIDGVCERYIADKPTNFIFGGREASSGEFPWMVTLGYFDINSNGIAFACGGTIISEQFILTAAHCTTPNKPPVMVRIGTIFLNDTQFAKNYFVKDIIQHENYSNLTKKNDIALLRLTERITFDSKYRPACLETDPRDKGPDVALNVTGWGAQSEESPNLSNVLLVAGLKTVPWLQCKTIFLNYNKRANDPAFRDGLSEGQYCANDPNRESFSCKGDSGGPLQVFRDSKTAHIVGIVSFGVSCGHTYPAIFTRVAHYTDWIASYVWPDIE